MGAHHEISVPLAVLPFATVLAQMDGIIVAMSGLASTAWFLWCFYEKWKNRRDRK